MPIQKLLDVQEIDLKIREMEIETATIPKLIQEREKAIDLKRAELADLEEKIEENRKVQRQAERRVEKKQEELLKYNSQLPLIKTNREYKAILIEIDLVEKEISNFEEEVLVAMDSIETMEAEIKEKEEETRKVEEETEAEKERLRENQRALEKTLEGSRSERENLATTVDNRLLSEYDRIRLHKGGLAIALIEGESCGACHMALPPQVVNEAIGGTVKLCPSCSRLLFLNEV
jgi:hypothetical protein